MIYNGDVCPKCGKREMPKWKSIYTTARACQSCKFIETRPVITYTDGEKPK